MTDAEFRSKHMTDAEFMEWLYERMHNVYGESVNVDFMQRLRSIIDNMKGEPC